jgi:hypothetical protein
MALEMSGRRVIDLIQAAQELIEYWFRTETISYVVDAVVATINIASLSYVDDVSLPGPDTSLDDRDEAAAPTGTSEWYWDPATGERVADV